MEDFLTLLLAGISVGAVYGLIAIGLNLTFWTTKTMNFGQGSVMMLCAMLTATLIAQVRMIVSAEKEVSSAIFFRDNAEKAAHVFVLVD